MSCSRQILPLPQGSDQMNVLDPSFGGSLVHGHEYLKRGPLGGWDEGLGWTPWSLVGLGWDQCSGQQKPGAGSTTAPKGRFPGRSQPPPPRPHPRASSPWSSWQCRQQAGESAIRQGGCSLGTWQDSCAPRKTMALVMVIGNVLPLVSQPDS